MKIGIFYFSGSGNTKYAAEAVFDSFGSVCPSCDVFIDKISHGSQDVKRFDLVILCLPIYAWEAPWFVSSWVRNNKTEKNTPIAFFCTFAGDDANAIYKLAKLSGKSGFEVINWARHAMPESWTVVRTEEYVKSIPERLTKKEKTSPSVFVRDTLEIINNKREVKPVPKRKFTWYDLVSPFYRKRMLKRIYKLWLTKDTCIKCGKCALICPTNSIAYKDGYPVFSKPCASCYGCINICPTNSIESYFTKGKIRYTPDLSYFG